MTIIEQLWHGQLHPAEITKPLDPQYTELLDTAHKAEKKLLPLLTDEGKELYHKLSQARSELYSMDEYDIFTKGFQMGARLMLEIMENTNDNKKGE